MTQPFKGQTVYVSTQFGAEKPVLEEQLVQHGATISQESGSRLVFHLLLIFISVRYTILPETTNFAEKDKEELEALQKLGVPIIGEPCLRYSVHHNLPLPLVPEDDQKPPLLNNATKDAAAVSGRHPGPFHPVYSRNLEGLVISTTGFNEISRNNLRTLVRLMAGRYERGFNQQVTHLLVERVILSDKYFAAVSQHIPIVKPTWIYDCWQQGKRQPIRLFQVEAFHGLQIALEGFPTDLHSRYKQFIRERKGNYVSKGSSTGGVVPSECNWEKYRQAKAIPGIRIVRAQWLVESFCHDVSLKETQFAVDTSGDVPRELEARASASAPLSVPRTFTASSALTTTTTRTSAELVPLASTEAEPLGLPRSNSADSSEFTPHGQLRVSTPYPRDIPPASDEAGDAEEEEKAPDHIDDDHTHTPSQMASQAHNRDGRAVALFLSQTSPHSNVRFESTRPRPVPEDEDDTMNIVAPIEFHGAPSPQRSPPRAVFEAPQASPPTTVNPVLYLGKTFWLAAFPLAQQQKLTRKVVACGGIVSLAEQTDVYLTHVILHPSLFDPTNPPLSILDRLSKARKCSNPKFVSQEWLLLTLKRGQLLEEGPYTQELPPMPGPAKAAALPAPTFPIASVEPRHQRAIKDLSEDDELLRPHLHVSAAVCRPVVPRPPTAPTITGGDSVTDLPIPYDDDDADVANGPSSPPSLGPSASSEPKSLPPPSAGPSRPSSGINVLPKRPIHLPSVPATTSTASMPRRTAPVKDEPSDSPWAPKTFKKPRTVLRSDTIKSGLIGAVGTHTRPAAEPEPMTIAKPRRDAANLVFRSPSDEEKHPRREKEPERHKKHESAVHHRHRDKEKDKEKEKSKRRDKDRERDRDKEKSKDKDRRSSKHSRDKSPSRRDRRGDEERNRRKRQRSESPKDRDLTRRPEKRSKRDEDTGSLWNQEEDGGYDAGIGNVFFPRHLESPVAPESPLFSARAPVPIATATPSGSKSQEYVPASRRADLAFTQSQVASSLTPAFAAASLRPDQPPASAIAAGPIAPSSVASFHQSSDDSGPAESTPPRGPPVAVNSQPPAPAIASQHPLASIPQVGGPVSSTAGPVVLSSFPIGPAPAAALGPPPESQEAHRPTPHFDDEDEEQPSVNMSRQMAVVQTHRPSQPRLSSAAPGGHPSAPMPPYYPVGMPYYQGYPQWPPEEPVAPPPATGGLRIRQLLASPPRHTGPIPRGPRHLEDYLPRPLVQITRVDPPISGCQGGELVFVSFMAVDQPDADPIVLEHARVMFGHHAASTTLDTHTRHRFWVRTPRVERPESTPLSLVDDQGRTISTTTPAVMFQFAR